MKVIMLYINKGQQKVAYVTNLFFCRFRTFTEPLGCVRKIMNTIHESICLGKGWVGCGHPIKQGFSVSSAV